MKVMNFEDGTRITHHGDFKGDVAISVYEDDDKGGRKHISIEVPAEHLIDFGKKALKYEVVNFIEQQYSIDGVKQIMKVIKAFNEPAGKDR